MKEIYLKGRICEVIEGGKVSTTNLLSELRNMPEYKVFDEKYVRKVLDEMILDETIKRVLVEENGKVNEYLELNE